jgi:hypothetical protein
LKPFLPPLAYACRAAACVAVLTSIARADGPAPALRLFQAGDIPGLSAGFTLPRPGEYKVWAWSSTDATSLAVDKAALTLTLRAEAKDDAPAWREIGKLTYDGKAPLVLKVATPGEKKASPRPLPPLLAFAADKPNLERALDFTRGRVKSIDPVVDPRRTMSRTRNEGANFRPPLTKQAWLEHAERVRSQVLVSLGLWPMFPKTPLNPQVYGKLDRDGYTIEKVVLETLPGFTLSGNLYRPKGKTGRLPLVFCPHGHWKEGRVNVDVQSRCIWLAKRLGCVVFMYDMVGYADSEPFGHAFLDDRLKRWGMSLPTLQTWNSIRALDWALTLPDVDPNRVGCTGESGGGTQTFLLAAIDSRIKVVAPVVMVSHKMQGGCVCENAAGLRIGTDNVEIAALAAPRPLKIVGANDWTDETLSFEYPSLMSIYALTGSADRLSADKFDFEHNYNRTSRNAVYAFLGKWLAGIDDPAATVEREGDVKPEAREILYTFDKEHPYPSDSKTPSRLEEDLVGVAGRAIDRLAPTTAATPWEASRDFLLASLRIRVGLVEPAAMELATQEVRTASRDGLSIVHSTVSRVSAGDRVPVVKITPAKPGGQATVVFTARGKSDLIGPDGKPVPIVRALLDRGQSVIGFDPLFQGESLDPRTRESRRPEVDHFETYNPSLAADHAQDLATVLAWGRSRPDIRGVNLVALGEAGPLALLARPMLSDLGRTAIDLNGLDYGDGSTTVPAALDLPGVLQFGGLKAAAALSAPAQMRIWKAASGFNAVWPVKAYALADSSAMLRLEDAAPDPAALARWIDRGE